MAGTPQVRNTISANVADNKLTEFNEQVNKLPPSFVKASTAGTAEKLSLNEPCHRIGGCPYGKTVSKSGGWHCEDCRYEMTIKRPLYKERTIDEVSGACKKVINPDKKSLVVRE